jgi:hypothetical protein
VENRDLTFELTAQHITLLRAMYVGWQDCETGAPEIDPKRPYGNSAVAEDVAELLNIPFVANDDEEVSEELIERLLTIHRSTEIALQVVLTTGSFMPGTYERSYPWRNDWKLVDKKR